MSSEEEFSRINRRRILLGLGAGIIEMAAGVGTLRTPLRDSIGKSIFVSGFTTTGFTLLRLENPLTAKNPLIAGALTGMGYLIGDEAINASRK